MATSTAPDVTIFKKHISRRIITLFLRAKRDIFDLSVGCSLFGFMKRRFIWQRSSSTFADSVVFVSNGTNTNGCDWSLRFSVCPSALPSSCVVENKSSAERNDMCHRSTLIAFGRYEEGRMCPEVTYRRTLISMNIRENQYGSNGCYQSASVSSCVNVFVVFTEPKSGSSRVISLNQWCRYERLDGQIWMTHAMTISNRWKWGSFP